MALQTASGVGSIASLLGLAIIYWFTLWRIIKANRGNRVIACGSITLMLFFLMALLIKLPNVPDWVLPSLGVLLLLLCLLTMLFLVLQAIQWIRRRRSKAVPVGESVSTYSIPEVGYEPRSFREKWLLRTVYWGTIFTVAFALWEYIKAR